MNIVEIMAEEEKEGQADNKDIIKTTLRINADKFWSLKQLAVERRKTVTEIMDEAIDDIFAKYGHRKGVVKKK